MNAEVRAMKTAAEQGLATEWLEAKARLPGFADVREAAFARFEKAGLPHRRVEEWKYTDLRALMREAKPLANPPDAAALAQARDAGRILSDLGARKIVLVNGYAAPDLSDPFYREDGVSIQFQSAALKSGDAWAEPPRGTALPGDDVTLSLNTAFMTDGVVIRIAKGMKPARPIHIAHVVTGNDPSAVFTRSRVIVEPGARIMLVETHEGAGADDYQVNTALELFVGDGAHVDHVKITQERASALHLSSLRAAIGAQARFNAFTYTTGGAVVRNQLFLRFDGEGTLANIRGATLLNGRQHVDTTLVADHAAGGCQSREVFKTVLDGESRGVFQGKIIVRQHAQKTDAKMASHALLLSDTAEADNKPELEIFADDVQCGHGATAGDLDEDLLFYLRARGIPAKEAEALLIQAFVGEAIEGIEHAGLREALTETVSGWLAARSS
jgi:Fe-S cluster assembly protein SufD